MRFSRCAKDARRRLGASDQRRMDEFLDSVRAVEREVVGELHRHGRHGLFPDAFLRDAHGRAVGHGAAPYDCGYSKESHADAMNELIALAFECDLTRVISYMLEDERSEFTYDHVQERAFTAAISSPKGGACPEYHSAQHEGGDRFASITWWNVGKVAELCRRLDAIKEANDASVLDNTVVFLGSCMHGGDHLGNRAAGRADRRRQPRLENRPAHRPRRPRRCGTSISR